MYIFKEILGGHTRVVNVAGLSMLQGHSVGKYDRHTFINILQMVMLHVACCMLHTQYNQG